MPKPRNREEVRKYYVGIFEYASSYSINKTMAACGYMYRYICRDLKRDDFDESIINDIVELVGVINYAEAHLKKKGTPLQIESLLRMRKAMYKRLNRFIEHPILGYYAKPRYNYHLKCKVR